LIKAGNVKLSKLATGSLGGFNEARLDQGGK